jgi:hypothetical protein
MIDIPEDAFEGVTSSTQDAQQPIIPQDTESWSPWIERNIKQSPAALYKMGRTGLGLGDLLNYVFAPSQTNIAANDPNKSIYDYLANYNQGALTALGNEAQAQKEAESIFPQSMTQFQPGDWLSQYAIPELAMIGLGGGFKSLSALRTGIQSSLGALGGGKAAEMASSLLPQDYEWLTTPLQIGGQILGGIAGGSAFNPEASVVPTTRMSPQKVIHTLKKEQTPLYATAKKLERPASIPATKLSDTINDITSNLEGFTTAQKTYLTEMAKDVNDIIEKNGTISIPKAKSLRKRINNQIYDRNLAEPVKGDLRTINERLKDYILENSSAEHNKNWLRAEETTVQIKNLQKQLKESKSPLNQLINVGRKAGTAATLGGTLKALGLSSKGSAIGGGLSLLAHRIYNEKQYLNQLAYTSPRLYKEYKNILKSAVTAEAFKTSQRLNRLAEKINQELPIEQEAPPLEIPPEAFDYGD